MLLLDGGGGLRGGFGWGESSEAEVFCVRLVGRCCCCGCGGDGLSRLLPAVPLRLFRLALGGELAVAWCCCWLRFDRDETTTSHSPSLERSSSACDGGGGCVGGGGVDKGSPLPLPLLASSSPSTLHCSRELAASSSAAIRSSPCGLLVALLPLLLLSLPNTDNEEGPRTRRGTEALDR